MELTYVLNCLMIAWFCDYSLCFQPVQLTSFRSEWACFEIPCSCNSYGIFREPNPIHLSMAGIPPGDITQPLGGYMQDVLSFGGVLFFQFKTYRGRVKNGQ